MPKRIAPYERHDCNFKRHARECGHPRGATGAIISGLYQLHGVDARVRGHDEEAGVDAIIVKLSGAWYLMAAKWL
jgi:hypothetical protein